MKIIKKISRNVKPRLGGDRFAWFVYVLGKILRCTCLFFHFLFEMPQLCIAYGCANSSDMEIKKSWHRLPLENKELLSEWLAKIRRTNTPVNEHSRLCGDHFEVDCFKKLPGSSRVNLKPGSIPTKFCFVQEKTPRKLPAERAKIGLQKTTTFKRKQPVRWYCRIWDWQHEARDREVWRKTVEKKNQRIGTIPGERNCPKENSWRCSRNQEIICEKFATRSKGI